MSCRVLGVHFFGRESRASDSVGHLILLFKVLRERRKRGDTTFVRWLAVKPPKPCRLGASSYQETDWHYNKPEMKMPTPNGRWHGYETSSYWDAVIKCSAAE